MPDIVVSFKKDSSNYTFTLPVRIAEDFEVDLILGLQTIKNLNLVKTIPEFFQNLDQITPTEDTLSPWKKQRTSSKDEDDTSPTLLIAAPTITPVDTLPDVVKPSAPIPLHVPEYYTGPTIPLTIAQPQVTPTVHVQLASPVCEYYTGPTPPSISSDPKGLKPSSADNQRQDNLMSRGACKKKRCTSSCGCQKNSTAALVEKGSVESTLLPKVAATPVLLPLGQSSTGLNTDRGAKLATSTSSTMAPAQTRGYVAALLSGHEESPEVQPFGPEEIDYKSKDTFAPFQDNSNTDETYLVDLIQIAGSPVQIANIRAICLKRKKLFRNTLGPEPARNPPFRLDVTHIKWRQFKNRVAPRQQSLRKQIGIRKQIEAVLKAGIIRISDASYYSQVILALKPDGSFRFCIDYRNLNDATESASWSIPNIRQMLARLGSYKGERTTRPTNEANTPGQDRV